MKKLIPLIFILLFFLIIKITNLSVRISDTNIYFNLADQILHGKLIYKDIFFANFPLFSIVSSLYFILLGKNIELFYLTSTLEVLATTSLIYYITFKKTKDYVVSLTTAIIYIFSFIVLSTSDHQTGTITASLFAVLGFLFLQKNKIIFAGIFVALSLMTKAYFIPVPLTFFFYLLLQKRWKDLFSFSAAGIITSLLVLSPFLIQAPKQLFSDIFGFSLTRPAGIIKDEVGWFFIKRDPLLFILLIFNILNFRKNKFFALSAIFSIILFLGFGDLYYLYLNFAVPFICLSFYQFYFFFTKSFNLQKLVIPTIVFVFVIFNLFVYFSDYRSLQKINNIDQIVNLIKKEKPDYLYGVHDITPALLYMTKVPALENVTDAYDYFFTRKLLDKEFLTKRATQTKTIVIAHGASYPQFNIEEQVADEIFDKNLLLKYCKLIGSFPVYNEGVSNRMNLFKCY